MGKRIGLLVVFLILAPRIQAASWGRYIYNAMASDTSAITTVSVSTSTPTEILSSTTTPRRGVRILNKTGGEIQLSVINSTQTASQYPLANNAEFSDNTATYMGAWYALAASTGSVKIFVKY